MSIDDSKTIKAGDIVREPDAVYSFTSAYILLLDTTFSGNLNNLILAVNILADAGWEIGELEVEGTNAYVMCRNPNYKRKREVIDAAT